MPRLQSLALACLLLAATTSATGVRGAGGDDVAAPAQPHSRELGMIVAPVEGVESTDLGCFRDRKARQNRVFGWKNVDTQVHMTPETCASLCLGKGKNKYFGLQAGCECWCGESGVDIDKWGTLPQNRCNKPCTGDSSKTCGGHLSFQAFEFGASPQPAGHLGCFADKKCSRMFSRPPIMMHKTLTPENCKAECGPDYAYYAVERGHQCWCGKGNEKFDKNGPSDECSYRCTGDHTGVCGGHGAMNVFAMHCDEDEEI